MTINALKSFLSATYFVVDTMRMRADKRASTVKDQHNMTQAITNFRAVQAQEIAANLEGYLEYGAESRAEYLAMLADDFCVPLSTVRAMAGVLGPTEDFDGLVCALEDGDGHE